MILSQINKQTKQQQLCKNVILVYIKLKLQIQENKFEF